MLKDMIFLFANWCSLSSDKINVYQNIAHGVAKKEREVSTKTRWTGLDNWEYVDNGTTKTNKKIVRAELKRERE